MLPDLPVGPVPSAVQTDPSSTRGQVGRTTSRLAQHPLPEQGALLS